jgi:hypothetical protein
MSFRINNLHHGVSLGSSGFLHMIDAFASDRSTMFLWLFRISDATPLRVADATITFSVIL